MLCRCVFLNSNSFHHLKKKGTFKILSAVEKFKANAIRAATAFYSVSSLKQKRGRTACELKSKVQLCDVFHEMARCEWEIKWSEMNSLHIVWGVLESFNCINFPLEIIFIWIESLCSYWTELLKLHSIKACTLKFIAKKFISYSLIMLKNPLFFDT